MAPTLDTRWSFHTRRRYRAAIALEASRSALHRTAFGTNASARFINCTKCLKEASAAGEAKGESGGEGGRGGEAGPEGRGGPLRGPREEEPRAPPSPSPRSPSSSLSFSLVLTPAVARSLTPPNGRMATCRARGGRRGLASGETAAQRV